MKIKPTGRVVPTIEYRVGNRTIRRRLDRRWACPACGGDLAPDETLPAASGRRLRCDGCGDVFRVVHIETPAGAAGGRGPGSSPPGRKRSPPRGEER